MINLQDILIRANQEAYPQFVGRQSKVKRVPRSIKKHNARKKEADRKSHQSGLVLESLQKWSCLGQTT